MTPIDYRIGYKVKVEFKDCITKRDLATNINWGILLEKFLWKKHHKPNYFKGTIVDIRTHRFFGLLKLKEPIYTVELDLPVDIREAYIETKYPKLIINADYFLSLYTTYKILDNLLKDDHINGN